MITSQELHDRIVGQNVPKRFLANVARNGATTVLQWKNSTGEWDTWTLDELAGITARLTSALKDLGVGHGDRVVLMIRNRAEFHPLDLAVLFCGATPVSIYNSSAPEQVEYLVNDCGAKVAIVEDSGFLERFLKVRDALPDDRAHRRHRAVRGHRRRHRTCTPTWRRPTPPTSPSRPRPRRPTTSPRSSTPREPPARRRA